MLTEIGRKWRGPMLEFANAARDRRDWTEATQYYRAYLRKNPRAFAIWVQLGHALKESGRRADALVAYSHALALRPRDPDLLLNLGHLHKLMGHRDDAISFFRRSAELGNAHAKGEFARIGGHLTIAAVRADAFDQATDSSVAAAPVVQTNPPVFGRFDGIFARRIRALADRARDRRDWVSAANLYERYLRAKPKDAAIWVQFGHALKESARLSQAKAAYARAMDLTPTSADAYFQFGQVLKIMGSPNEAGVYFAHAFRLDPRTHGAHEELRRLGVGAEDLLRLYLASTSLQAVRLDRSEDDVLSSPLAERSIVQHIEPVGSSASRAPVGHNPDQALDFDAERPWLPRVLDSYWLPQSLRDYLISRYGESIVNSTEYLMAILNWKEKNGQDYFESSNGSVFLKELSERASLANAKRRPKVSIIIPVYNNSIYTLTCIASILLQDHLSSYEIIVGDDGSNDNTYPTVSALGGCVRIVRQPKNLGFLQNCNSCAENAIGDYLIFLNNDTLALPGWLDNLLLTFDRHDRVGFVGSKLLNADGTLQEAGGIFWSDGSAWNFGRNADATAPEFNYFKDVDYCSGASIAFPRELWTRLGGFDPAFSPAYCEDADIAFRVRDAGYRSVYQPRSELIHHEGKSHGTDTASGVKAYQIVNSKKLFERWRHKLEREHFSNAQEVFVARDRSATKPHILFIDHYVPQQDRDAGSRTLYQYVKFFVDHGFQVTFWPDNLYEDREYTHYLQQIGVEVIYSKDYVGKFDQWLSERRNWIKYVFASRPHVSISYLASIRERTDAKIFYYGHDLHWKRMEKEYELTNNEVLLGEIANQRVQEESVMQLSDHVMYPSADECQLVRAAFPDKSVMEFPIYIYPQAEIEEARRRIELQGALPGEGARDILFVGGFSHRPNLDGVTWFLSEVEPIIRRLSPDIRVLIVGSNAPEELRAKNAPGVEILGRVSDEVLAALHRTSAAMIVPLRYGAGVKGKIIDAFAKGLPVVSTSVGLQGVDEPDLVAFQADEPEAFARAVVQALDDRSLAFEKARKALKFIEGRYTEAAVVSMFGEFMPELGGSRPSR